MNTSTPAILAVEVRRHSPTRWVATYYPMVSTPAGRWADVTWALHHHEISATISVAPESTRWLKACSPDPEHSCYAGHQNWAPQLAAGYATALGVHTTEATDDPPSSATRGRSRTARSWSPLGSSRQWMLDDLQDETSPAHG